MAIIKLLGLQRDFQAHQGNDFMADFILALPNDEAVDMTGWTAAAEIRYSSTGRVAITCTLANGYLSWMDQATGKFSLRIPAAATSALLFAKDTDTLDLSYDIELDSNSSYPGRFKPFYGTISLMREQTRIS